MFIFSYICQKSWCRKKRKERKGIHIVLSLKITKSTVFWKFFSRDTAVSCSMCKKLCPLACNARTKHRMNNLQWTQGGAKGRSRHQEQNRPSSEDLKRHQTVKRRRGKRREGERESTKRGEREREVKRRSTTERRGDHAVKERKWKEAGLQSSVPPLTLPSVKREERRGACACFFFFFFFAGYNVGGRGWLLLAHIESDTENALREKEKDRPITIGNHKKSPIELFGHMQPSVFRQAAMSDILEAD